jgi:thioredoxin 1
MTNVIHLSDSTFRSEVLEAKEPVLVDFWAPWCGPCKMLAPVVEELADDYRDKVKICKLNVEENQERAGEYGVMSIPTIVLFKDGKEIKRMVGVSPKVNIKHQIDAVL